MSSKLFKKNLLNKSTEEVCIFSAHTDSSDEIIKFRTKTGGV